MPIIKHCHNLVHLQCIQRNMCHFW